jgi:hypothetical protein
MDLLRVSHPVLQGRYHPCLGVCPDCSSAAAGDWVTRTTILGREGVQSEDETCAGEWEVLQMSKRGYKWARWA